MTRIACSSVGLQMPRPAAPVVADAPPFDAAPWGRRLAALLLAALLLRVIASAVVPLIPEEAYYWMYAQHPSLSYFDHPPMVAWTIGLGTAIFGHNEFGVRFVGSACMIGASVLMFAFARLWFDRGAALLAAAMLHVLPVYFGVGLVATMDSSLLFFWLLFLLGVGVALERQRQWAWYLAAIGFGGALLSKYTGVFLAPGLGLALLLHRPWRRELRNPHVYLAALLGLLMFAPVLVWNVTHDWASFRFQFLDRFDNDPISLHHVLAFLFSQVVVLTPVLLVALVMLGRRVMRRPRRAFAKPALIMAWCFSLPLLAVMAHKSLRYDIHLNWTLPAFLSLMPAMAHLVVAAARSGSVALRGWAPAAAWTGLVCLGINIVLLAYLVVLQPYLGWIEAFGPWDGLAAVVEEHEDRLEEQTGQEPLVIADGKYRLASVLAFYRLPIESGADSPEFTTSQWALGEDGLGFAYWVPADHWAGRDCILVTEIDEDVVRITEGRFDSVEVVDDPRLTRSGYRLAVCRGLRL